MLSPADERFLKTAVAGVPRIAEIIASYPAASRQGALEVAESRYMQAARDFGCTEEAASTWAALLMRNLQERLEQRNPLKRLFETAIIIATLSVTAYLLGWALWLW
jgi:hypothetical protein